MALVVAAQLLVVQEVVAEAPSAQAADMVGSFAHFVSIALDLWEIAAVVEAAVPTVGSMVALAAG